MTTLVAIQGPNDVELGWDSLVTSGNEAWSSVDDKVFVNAGLVFGVAGLIRAADLIRYAKLPEYDPVKFPDARRWLHVKLVPILRAIAASDNSLTNDEGVPEGWGMFVVVDGELFSLDSLFSPSRTEEGVRALGSGGDYALGALAAGADVLGSLLAAARFDPATGGRLVVTTASDLILDAAERGMLEDPTEEEE